MPWSMASGDCYPSGSSDSGNCLTGTIASDICNTGNNPQSCSTGNNHCLIGNCLTGTCASEICNSGSIAKI